MRLPRIDPTTIKEEQDRRIRPERALAIAILKRAWLESTGHIGGVRNRAERMKLRSEAAEWILECGYWFRYWCYMAGVEPMVIRGQFLKLNSQYSGGSPEGQEG